MTPAVVVDANEGEGDGADGADAAPDPPEGYTMGTRTYAATDEASRAILDADVSARSAGSSISAGMREIIFTPP